MQLFVGTQSEHSSEYTKLAAVLVESYALSATFAMADTIAWAEYSLSADASNTLSADVLSAISSQVDVRYHLLRRGYSTVHSLVLGVAPTDDKCSSYNVSNTVKAGVE
jgi:hypothetical protein